MMSKRSINLLVVVLLFSCNALSQKKFERESRLTKSELPDFAVAFESIFKDGQSIKWYLEEGLERYSIEAKYKRNGKRYSVEFDTLGTLEDVEIEIDQSEIPQETYRSICERLSAEGDRHKIDKIQIQYTGEEQVLKEVSVSGKCEVYCVTRYELVVRIRKDKELSSFEYLFSEDGTLERRSEIIIQTSSNLEY
ncbi:MAG: hypothetical protein HWE22_06190 [Flavobacteriales bacterium]|nr:hypothetical protein [Flavobacteriales bacterium]